MASPEWHWEQGIKYAVEAIKVALALNGAAAIAVMTFGGSHGFMKSLIWALVAFALGATASVLAFLFGYLAQLEYGNAEIVGADKSRVWKKAQCRNTVAIVLFVASVVFFGVGVGIAGYGLYPISTSAGPGT
jgi:hypothetical protein